MKYFFKNTLPTSPQQQMSNLELLVTDDNTITFGDFTQAEILHCLNLQVSNPISQPSYSFHSKLTPQEKKTNSTFCLPPSNSSVVIFGDFTQDDCIKNQESNAVFNDQVDRLLPNTSSQTHQYVVPIQRNKSHHSQYSNSHLRHSPPTSPYRKKYCIRCGYNSHTIEHCVAVRHRSGDYIGYPYNYHSHTHNNQSQTFYANPSHSSDLATSSLRPGDFVFNVSDLKEWMINDYEYRLNVYMDEWMSQSEPLPAHIEEDKKINETLYLDYLTTNLIFENQAAQYFKCLYQTR